MNNGTILAGKVLGTEDIEGRMEDIRGVVKEVWQNEKSDKVTSIYTNYELDCIKLIKFTTLLHNVLSVGVDKFVDHWRSSNFEFFANEEIVGMDVYFKRIFSALFL